MANLYELQGTMLQIECALEENGVLYHSTLLYLNASEEHRVDDRALYHTLVRAH